MSVMSTTGRELDVEVARRRMAEAAAEARRLQEENAGFAVFDAWNRYELIKNAIEAQERQRRVAERLRGTER